MHFILFFKKKKEGSDVIYNMKMKIVINILYFKLFVNVSLKTKVKKENDLTNKAFNLA